jgi:hypothetical protein
LVGFEGVWSNTREIHGFSQGYGSVGVKQVLKKKKKRKERKKERKREVRSRRR